MEALFMRSSVRSSYWENILLTCFVYTSDRQGYVTCFVYTCSITLLY